VAKESFGNRSKPLCRGTSVAVPRWGRAHRHSSGPTGQPAIDAADDGYRVRRRQSDAHGPSLSAGLGPGRRNTDFVVEVSASLTPVSRCSLAAVPLIIKA